MGVFSMVGERQQALWSVLSLNRDSLLVLGFQANYLMSPNFKVLICKRI